MHARQCEQQRLPRVRDHAGDQRGVDLLPRARGDRLPLLRGDRLPLTQGLTVARGDRFNGFESNMQRFAASSEKGIH